MKRFLSIILAFSLGVLALSLCACGEKKSVAIKYADGQAIMTMLIEDKIEYGLLPEPVATKLEKVVGKDYTWHRQSLQELYDGQTKSYPQAVLMVKSDIVESYPQLINAVAQSFSANVSWVEQKPSLAVNAVAGKYSNTSLKPAAVISAQVVDNCSISWQWAKEAKDSVKSYLLDLLSIEIGLGITPAKEVGDDFFCGDLASSGDSVSGKSFTFIAPDGAPALAIAKFISDGENFIEGASFEYTVTSADDITKYMNGVTATSDFIILPVNAASLAYDNFNAQYKMAAVITHGNLYIMSKNQGALSDLNGKTIGVIGQGKVPDLTLKCVLNKNNFNYSTVA